MFYTYAYIDTQKHNVDYIGKTNDIQRRDKEHRTRGDSVFDKAYKNEPSRWKMIPLSYHESEDEAYRMEEALYKIHQPRLTFRAGKGTGSNTDNFKWGYSAIDKAGGLVCLMHEKSKSKSMHEVGESIGSNGSTLHGWLKNRNLKWADIPGDESYEDDRRKRTGETQSRKNNKTGYLYVTYKSDGRYRYRRTIKGKSYHISAKTLEELEHKVKSKNLEWRKL